MGVLITDEDTRIRARCSNEISIVIIVIMRQRLFYMTSKRRYRCDGCSMASLIIFPCIRSRMCLCSRIIFHIAENADAATRYF